MIVLDDRERDVTSDERLAAIAQMAVGLSHESRGALQSIGASAEMLELELEGNSTALKHVARIRQSQMRLHRLFVDVQTYAGLTSLDKSTISVREVWREAWKSLHSERASRRADLKEHIATANLFIAGDRFRLIQVFRNLFENSLAAAQDPVEIEVLCTDAAVDSMPGVRVAVLDNGSGFGLQEQQRVFEPFFTTKPTGTGLGLAIAQRIIAAHGGTIGVSDRDSPGAEVVIVLPR